MMQIIHEAQLLKPQTRESKDFVFQLDQLVDHYTLNSGRLDAIEYMSSCPGASLLAVYIEKSCQIVILDTKSHAKRDKFLLKACKDKFSRRSFTVKGVSFSPDGLRLAIGQSDCIIYLYKLFQHSASQECLVNAKATITGKFVCSSPIACLVWSELGIIFGTQDGKIKLITTTTMKTAPVSAAAAPDNQSSKHPSTRVISLHVAPKACLPISLAFRSRLLVISFIDCSVAVATLTEDLVQACVESHVETTKRHSVSSPISFSSFEHTCPAYHLTVAQNNTIFCAGHDGRLSIVQTTSGNKYDTSHSISLKEEVRALQYSEVNEIVAVATVMRLLFVKHDQKTGTWQLQTSYIELQNVLAITSLCWLKDGSQLALACLDGSIELFRCTWNNESVGEQLEICHIAKNRVRITDKERNLLATYKSRHDIKRVNVIDKGLSVIIWTSGSLLLARMCQPSLRSEVQWSNRDKNLQFCFEHLGFVLIYNRISLQLNLIRLGEDSVIFCDKVSRIRSRAISVRKYPSGVGENPMSLATLQQATNSGLNKSRQSSLDTQETFSLKTEESTVKEPISSREKIAYSPELNQLLVVDLKSVNGRREIQRNHEQPIERVSINYTCTSLIFMDQLKELFLINLSASAEPRSLMKSCEFCQWFENSDILVAQRNHTVVVWYDVKELKRVQEFDTRSYNITNKPPIVDLSFANNRSSLSFPVVVKTVANELGDEFFLQLSNGCMVLLDTVRIKFHLLLVRDVQLGSLFKMLNQEDSQVEKHVLWDKLGWLAVEQNNCDIATRVFKKLKHESMVKYLEEAERNPDELECRLALLRGDWDTFEANWDAEKVGSVYRRLNKWWRLINYYESTQRFRQRDLAELEFMEWLAGRGRHFEAAQIQARSGDIFGAIEMLMENKKLADAVNLLIKFQKTALPASSGGLSSGQQRLVELCESLEQELLACSKYKEAALINDKILARPSHAFELYVKAEEYAAGLELANKQAASEKAAIEPSRVKECQLLLAERLLNQHRNNKLSRRLASAAVNHFRAGGEIVRALEAAMELGQHRTAYEILVENKEILLKEDADRAGGGRAAAAKVAEHLLCRGSIEEAIEAYLIAGRERRAAELYMEAQNYEKAYDIMLKHLNNGDEQRARDEFVRLATEERARGAYEKAEQIYVMLESWPEAIEMHRHDTKDYERMLSLVEKYQPDELEANLLLLARNLESEGDLERAERYLLRASESEWVNVVRMYRIAGRWPDAFRVAQAHCASPTDPLLVQLAYWWARSYDKSELAEARRLLVDQLKLFRQVIEFCCENKNFQFAIELSKEPQQQQQQRSKEQETLIRRYADHLESEHRFQAAEELLLEWGLPEEAARMYIDNDMLQAAIGVGERCLASVSEQGQEEERRGQVAELMNEILIRCADRLDEQTGGRQQRTPVANKHKPDEEERRLSQAQQMYLRAQRPELAVGLYRKRGRWQEAIQVAQRFAPHLLEGLEKELDCELSDEVLEVTGDMKVNGALVVGGDSQPGATGRKVLPSKRASSGAGGAASTVETHEIQDRLRMSTRAGDQDATRAALNRFLDSLVDG